MKCLKQLSYIKKTPQKNILVFFFKQPAQCPQWYSYDKIYARDTISNGKVDGWNKIKKCLQKMYGYTVHETQHKSYVILQCILLLLWLLNVPFTIDIYRHIKIFINDFSTVKKKYLIETNIFLLSISLCRSSSILIWPLPISRTDWWRSCKWWPASMSSWKRIVEFLARWRRSS